MARHASSSDEEGGTARTLGLLLATSDLTIGRIVHFGVLLFSSLPRKSCQRKMMLEDGIWRVSNLHTRTEDGRCEDAASEPRGAS